MRAPGLLWRFVLRIAAVCLTAGVVPAQFSQLATNDDGSILLFVTAQRQRGSDQTFTPKVFSIRDPGAISIVAERRPGESRFGTLASPDIDGSGQRIAWSAIRTEVQVVCVFLRCTTTTTTYAESSLSDRLGSTTTMAGRLRMSRSGRFGVLSDAEPIAPRTSLVDLVNGTRWELPGAGTLPLSGRRVVADNGAVLLMSGAVPLSVWTSSTGGRTIDSRGPVASAAITPNGRIVVYDSHEPAGSPRQLRTFDLATGRATTLFTSSEGEPLQPAISNDGTRVLYFSRGQLFVTDASGARQLTAGREGVNEAVLSGNGEIVYASTNAGRLLRIAAGSGAAEEMIPRTPQLHPGSTAVPGSYYRIWATGASNDVRVIIDGRTAPVLAVWEGEVVIQVPWDLEAAAPRMARVELVSGDSPFEHPPEAVALRAHNPRFEFFECAPDGLRCPAIVHQDWSSLVTPDNRAEPGEILHAYMTGLGPVEPTLANGEPGPAVARDSFACHMEEGNRRLDVPVFYAGVAPGMIGIYQVSFRMPGELISGAPWLVCGFGPDIDDTAIWWVLSRPNAMPTFDKPPPSYQ